MQTRNGPKVFFLFVSAYCLAWVQAAVQAVVQEQVQGVVQDNCLIISVRCKWCNIHKHIPHHGQTYDFHRQVFLTMVLMVWVMVRW